MRIVFRTDASLQIGSGHQVRCLTLANELKSRNCKVEIIAREVIGGVDFPLHKLVSVGENENYCPHSAWLGAHWKDDAEETIKYAAGADWLVIDHYGIDKRWESLVKPHVKKILVIDDLADREHRADLLLDQNYYTNSASRYKNLLDCETLLGPKYALLRPEFMAARKTRTQNNNVRKIFICFGGVDANDNTGKAVEALKDFSGEITVVVGAAYAHYESLSKNKRIQLLRGAKNIAELMAESDMAIGAGGGMTWERAALGLPTIAWPIAENQTRILQNMDNLGALKLSSPKEIDLNLNLKKMSEIAFNLCDAKGVGRVANHLLLNLRVAELKDSEEILKLRNLKEVRENSFDSAEIDFETHHKWFADSLNNPHRKILLLELQKEIIGVLRYDINGDYAVISLYINSLHSGNGYGEALLEKGEYWLKNYAPNIKQLVAEILDKNQKSKTLFTKLSYNKDGEFFRKII